MTLKNTEMYDIIITNKQTIDHESDIIEEKALGRYFIKNEKKCIMYTSADASTTIIADKNRVVMRRKGSVNSEMLFLCGRTTNFLYNMPYGSLSMSIDTREITDNLLTAGGSLKLVYILAVQEGKIYNDMKITVLKR